MVFISFSRINSYSISILIKISGLISLFIPISRLPLRKIKFDDLGVEDEEEDEKFGR